ncbi:hypothetical protein RB597_008037 [Gaeumannomyces tritici]
MGGATMSSEQQFGQGGLPTKFLAWDCLEVVRSCLSSRLANLRRVQTAQKPDNGAAFFEADLRFVFTIIPPVARPSLADHAEVESKATALLESLDTLVNGQFIDMEDEQEPEGWEPESSGDVPAPYNAEMLRDKYQRLYALIIFLEGAEGMLNLATGPGSPIFTLPTGAVWSSALDRIAEWKALLERLTADSRSSCSIELPSVQQPQMSAERTETQSGVLEKRASVVIGAMLKEFRRLNCSDGKWAHEIKLKVPGDLYTGPLRPVLDMFVSCCHLGDDKEMQWQEAECGTFEVEPEVESRDMCLAIKHAKDNHRKLHIFVNQELGLFDVSDRVPRVQSATCELETKSLSDLLRDRFFQDIKAIDGFCGTAHGKFGHRKKAVLTLSLAQCLMDFIDEELELASHSWNPKQIFFLYPKDTTASNGTLCISLRPKMARQQTLMGPAANLRDFIGPGNPVLLSFARLLLEIHDGDELPLNIDLNNTDSRTAAWGKMCSALETVARVASMDYLFDAVHGCLYLHFYLSEKEKGLALPAAAGVLRRVLYENVVRYLELMVNPDRVKRKRDVDDMADLPDPKKVSVPPPPPETGLEVLSTLLSGTMNSKTALDTQLILRPKEDDKGSPLLVPPVGRLIKNPCRKVERSLSERQVPMSTAVSQRKAIPTVTLYDDERTGENSDDAEMAKIYFSHLDYVREYFIAPLARHLIVDTEDERLRRPVRVAVLDSGVDMSDPRVKGAKKRIKAMRNWTDDNPENWEDSYGHGTHVVRQLIRVAPAAEVYVARVSTAKKVEPEKTGLIAKAINWAATVWDVDIISLSFGLDEDHQEIDIEPERVLSPGIKHGPKRIVIAAAANWAGNKYIAYPARHKRVICINATDGGGNPSKKNPTPRKDGDNFALLGLSIESRKRKKENESLKPAAGRGEGEALAGIGTAAAAGLIKPNPKRETVWISGTSYATPIAAGIAANVLEFARHHAELTSGERELLYSWFGMSRIFRAMSDVRKDYDYITPWKMFNPKHDTQTIVECIKEILYADNARDVMRSKK